ncbi:uncharacterized protein LOC111129591 isoform X3 [Crassostrea virginica]
MKTILVLILFSSAKTAATEICASHQSVILEPYVGTEIVFPHNFPLNAGYNKNLTCTWEIFTKKGFEIVVFPLTWSCSNSTTFHLSYNISDSAEVDPCIRCPVTKGYCLNFAQTQSSVAALNVYASSGDLNGGFNFRFIAVSSTSKADECTSSVLKMKANRTPKYIISPGFPDSYPSNLNCSWRIEPELMDNNTQLVFQFQSQNLERNDINNCADYVDIAGFGGMHDVFCETSSEHIMRSSLKMVRNSSVTTVRFVSDFGGGGSGFVLSFYLEVSVEILSFNVSQKSDLEGSPVTLIAEITDVYTYSVQWFRNEIMVTNASTRYKISSFPTANGTTKHILNITEIYKRDQGNWTVSASNGVTRTTRRVNIAVRPRIRLEMSPQYDFSIQSGQNVRIACNVSNPEALKYLVLRKDGINLTDAKNSSYNEIAINLTNVTTDNGGVYSCYYSNYSESVQMSIKVTITIKEQKVCRNETLNGIVWGVTLTNNAVRRSCPLDQIGTATRFCDSHGSWQTPILVNCTNKAFVNASQQLTVLIEDGTISDKTKIEKTVNNTLEVMKNLTSSNENLSVGDLKSSIDIIEQIVNVIASSGAKLKEKDFFKVVDNVLSKNNSQSWTTVKTETSKDASSVLKSMDSLSDEVMKGNNSNISFTGESFDLIFDQINVDEQSIKFPSSSDRMKIDTFLELPKQESNTETKYVAVIYKTISDILPTSADSKGSKKETNAVGKFVNSDILSLSTKENLGTLRPPLVLTFKHKNESTELQAVCVSWNFTTNKWSQKGCQKNSSMHNETVCQCNHLTNFAILMRPYVPETEDSRSLKTLSLVGVLCSITFIVLTLVVYILSWKHIKNDQNIMLLNLCVALILSYVVFISAVEKADIEILCTAVTVIIHYLFLVTFFNMLGMGVYYFMSITVTYYAMYVANNFKSKSRIHWFLTGAWGIPLVISTATLGAFWQKGYHLKNYCWLSIESGSLYLFIVPVCCVAIMNIVIIVSLIRVLCASSVMMKSTLQKKAASGLRSLGTLLPVLGVTWIFGILAINEDAEIFQYLFIIANSLQGVFIFISHVLLNKKLMQGLRTQYPSLGMLTSFTESSKKDVTSSRSQTFTSDDLMNKSKKGNVCFPCFTSKKVKTFESFSAEKTADTCLAPLTEKPLETNTEL